MKSLQIIKEIQAMLQENYNTKILGLSDAYVEQPIGNPTFIIRFII